MKIAMIQNNYIVGDFTNNTKKIISSCENNKNADLIVFSELTLSGYYPWDLIYRNSFDLAQEQSLNQILEYSKSISSHIVLGLVRKNTTGYGKPFLNSLIVIHNGNIVFDYDKKLLPTYNIFDEKRHFEEGVKNGFCNSLEINSKHPKIGFLICEDAWNDESTDYITNPVKDLINDGAHILISINASPSNIKKQEQRDKIFSNISKKYGVDFVYVNQVGANDEIVFDGASFVFDKNGNKVISLKSFEEDSVIYHTRQVYKPIEDKYDKYDFIFNQLKVGFKDYLQKQGFSSIVVGSSGGVDSALVLALAKLFIGEDKVFAITMPSKFSSSGSVDDSVELCKRLGVKLYNHPIVNEVSSYTQDFNKNIGTELQGLSLENLQARIRGTILMAYSNQLGSLLVNTSNKSETSVGYSTLYGDSCGGIGLIADLYKTEIYELCYWINKKFGNIIPENILTKEPSAELSPGQKDSDSLPDYDHLDAILKKELEWDFFTEEEKNEINTLIEEVSEKDYKRVLTLIDRAEFKRKQSAPIIRVHPLAFGIGRKIPIVHKCSVDQFSPALKNKIKI